MLSKIEALAIIDNPHNIFHCCWFTASRTSWRKKQNLLQQAANTKDKKKKAELVKQAEELEIGGLLIGHERCASMRTRGIHAKLEAAEARHSISYRKNPRHWKNRTRNIKLLPAHEIRKPHITLIMEVNHQTVLY